MMHGRQTREPQYIDMSPEDWAHIPDNPRQRDTELHALKATYLNEFRPPHALVDMAVLPDGQRFKLNGHTRSFLWSTKKVPAPLRLRVTVYPLNSFADVIEAYGWFDSAAASERGADIIQGAFKANGVRLKTGMLRNGRVGTALRLLFSQFTSAYGKNWHDYELVYQAVRHFSTELNLLDAMSPSPKMFPPGIQMAALITLKHDHADAIDFWKLYADQRGSKNGPTMDAVQALIEAVMKSKVGKQKGHATQQEIFAKALSAFQAYQSRNEYMVGGTGIRPMKDSSLKKYIEQQEGRIL